MEIGTLVHAVEGYMYPNEMELQWTRADRALPFITGLVAELPSSPPSRGSSSVAAVRRRIASRC